MPVVPPNLDDEKDTGQSEQPLEEEKIEDLRPCCFKYATPITKTWSVLTIAALWYCTVTIIRNSFTSEGNYKYTPYYALSLTVVVTLFEILWLINKCACCGDDGSCCCTVWRIFLWIDNWKKGVLYIGIAWPTFVGGIRALLSVVSGVLVIVLGIFYILKTIGKSDCIQKRKNTRTKYVNLDSPKANLVEHEVQVDTSRDETMEIKPEQTASYESINSETRRSSRPQIRTNPFDKSTETDTASIKNETQDDKNPFNGDETN